MPYNQLVHDRIPNIIQKIGETCRIHRLREQFVAHSTTTRQEGVSEYPLAMAAFKPLKEFADVLKVISYVAEAYDDTGKNLKSLRRDKSPRRGGVSQKLLALAH